MEKVIVPVPVEKLQEPANVIANEAQLACQLTINDKHLSIFNNAQTEIISIVLKELTSHV
ncbi:hypothetical protein FD12_GL000888 [Lentilactobacillus rapi DSM 19907 = JCM 15042]|uniref:Uncharacterized protein n=2 Tax=Lentilactobacillus rapi TaxID=481723 RepID=A0A512PMH0_9LACO|nr:hypothetical protein [Lentilactobacillus rapi]KRL18048.1 hypothetical protein FD12_GL000888 [Lentilactobacillus rapi DSM 19907 = JCM 15042]GEP72395.1 hypothetical protein LRA02_12630 [Lentilactobacillus rapi]